MSLRSTTWWLPALAVAGWLGLPALRAVGADDARPADPLDQAVSSEAPAPSGPDSERPRLRPADRRAPAEELPMPSDPLGRQEPPFAGAADEGQPMGADGMRRRQEQMNQERLRLLDRDLDGAVTLEEYLEAQQEVFRKCDTNGDGVLRMEELRQLATQLLRGLGETPPDGRGAPEAMLRERARRMLETMDFDRDGLVAPNEFDGPSTDFDKADADGDGALDASEIEAMLRKRMGPATAAAGAAGAPADPLTRLIDGRDRDGDGALDAREFPGDMGLFHDADGNLDGLLTAKELGNYLRDNPRAMRELGMRPGLEAAPEGRESRSALPAKVFETKDFDGDGRLSRSEIPEWADQIDALDDNGDGYLTMDEARGGAAATEEGPRRGARDRR